jgi:DNA polymerase III subunit beta
MKKQLMNAAKIAAKNKSLSECQHVLIDDVFITASNLDTFYTFKHDIPKVEGTGTVEVAQLKKAYDKLKSIDSIKFEDGKCQIVKGKTKLSFSSIPFEDWIKLPVTPSNKIGVVNLDANFDKAKKFVGNDDLRPVMTYVYYSKEQVVATNAHYMYFKNHGFDLEEDFLIRGDVFFASGEYAVYKEGDWIRLEGTDDYFTYRTDGDRFPNYDAVIPRDNPNVSLFNINEFKGNIETLLLTANSTTNQLSVYPEKMYSEDIDFGSSGSIDIVQLVEKGEPMDISFNGKLMIHCLSVLDGNVVSIETSAHNRAMILNECVLLMPVMRNN